MITNLQNLINIIMCVMQWVFQPVQDNPILFVLLVAVVFRILIGFFQMFHIIRRYPE